MSFIPSSHFLYDKSKIQRSYASEPCPLLMNSRHVANGTVVPVSSTEQVISGADEEPAGQHYYIVVHGQARNWVGYWPGAEEHDDD